MKKSSISFPAKSLIIIFSLLLLVGCSSNKTSSDPNDPFEGYNRAMFTFNDNLDQYVLKPVAKGYDFIAPSPVQKGVSNFFSNLDDIVVLVNDLFQFKFSQAASDTGRLLINSTLGLFGLIDWATDLGLEKHNEDFGQTLGYWGVPPGPYFVLPFLGPSTIRDAPGIAVDTAHFDPIYNELDKGFPAPRRNSESAIWGLTITKAIDTRTQLLKAGNILEEAALDRYIFIREAYMQRRKNLVYDGNPPEDDEDFDESDLFED